MKNKQTKEATKVRVDKKNEQDYQYQRIVQGVSEGHF